MEPTPIAIRSADRTDRARLRSIAHESFRASYSLSPQEIGTILPEVFADQPFAARLDNPSASLLVAERVSPDSDDIVGFVDLTTAPNPTIRWLHVDPTARGEGLGTALFERARAEAGDQAQPLRASVLEAAVDGGAFLERFGLERYGNDWVEFGGEAFSRALFTDGQGRETANDLPL